MNYRALSGTCLIFGTTLAFNFFKVLSMRGMSAPKIGRQYSSPPSLRQSAQAQPSCAEKFYQHSHFPNFCQFLFFTAIEVNPPERRLAKRTSVQCGEQIIRTKFPYYGNYCKITNLSLMMCFHQIFQIIGFVIW